MNAPLALAFVNCDLFGGRGVFWKIADFGWSDDACGYRLGREAQAFSVEGAEVDLGTAKNGARLVFYSRGLVTNGGASPGEF